MANLGAEWRASAPKRVNITTIQFDARRRHRELSLTRFMASAARFEIGLPITARSSTSVRRLAHAVGNLVIRAYLRSSAARRRRIMADWPRS